MGKDSRAAVECAPPDGYFSDGLVCERRFFFLATLSNTIVQGTGRPVNEQLKQKVSAALRWSPAQPYFRWRAARRLVVLAYHRVEAPARFEQHLDYIGRALHPVSVGEVLGAIAGRGGLPRHAVLITFDDGHRSVFETARPLLRARGMPAAVYVIAGLLGTDAPPWFTEAERLAERGGTARGVPAATPAALVRALKRVPDAARQQALADLRRTARGPAPAEPQLCRSELPMLEADGIAVGNHTLTHPCLNRCPESKVRHEIAESHRLLTDALGHAPRSFAYPNGDEDARVVRAVADCGYEAAFLFDHRLSPVPPPHPLRISRVRIDADAPLDRLRVITSGLHSAVFHATAGA